MVSTFGKFSYTSDAPLGRKIDPNIVRTVRGVGYALPDLHRDLRCGRQIRIDARPEADQSEALAGAHFVPLPQPAHDPAPHQARDLHEHQLPSIGQRQHHAAPLVVLARLVE